MIQGSPPMIHQRYEILFFYYVLCVVLRTLLTGVVSSPSSLCNLFLVTSLCPILFSLFSSKFLNSAYDEVTQNIINLFSFLSFHGKM